MAWVTIIVEHKCPTCKCIMVDKECVYINNVSDIGTSVRARHCNACLMARYIGKKTDVVHVEIPVVDDYGDPIFKPKERKAGFI